MNKKVLIVVGIIAVAALILTTQSNFFTQSYGITWSPSWRPSVGHKITATFTWHVMIQDNPDPGDRKNKFVIKDPDGNIRASKELTPTADGTTSLTVTADKAGDWVAEMRVWNYIYRWEQGLPYSKKKNVQPKKYALSVETVPSGAKTWIKETGETKTSPCTFYLVKGTYTVMATKSGYGIASKKITLTTDSKVILTLPPPPPKYTLTVKTNPYYCDVTIGGHGTKNSGTTGAKFTGLIEGYYIVHVEKTGYESKNERVYMDRDKTITVTLEPKTYTLTVKTNPTYADVTIVETGDTKNSGTSGAKFNLNHGTYTVRVEKEGYQTKTTTVTLNKDKTITVDLTEIPPTPPTIEISYTLEVVGATVTALGVALLLLRRL